MQTFEDAVRAARDAKASIAALQQGEDRANANLAALRAEFAREEQALVDAIAKAQLDGAEARRALQAALQRINDAPIEEQTAAQPAEILEPLTIESPNGMHACDEDVETGDDPGFEPLTEEAGRAATGFAS